MSDAGRVLVLAGPAGPLAAAARPHPDLETVVDLDRCLEELRAGPPVSLVVIDGEWPRPLSVARRIREFDGDVGLAFAVAPDEVEAMRSKLAFLPDAGDVAVVPVDSGSEGTLSRLAEVAASSHQRRRVRGALDRINRDLAGSSGAGPTGGATVSEHYLAALVRHAADTIVSIDPDGRIVTVNEAGQRALGIDPAEVEGQPLDLLLADDDPGRLSRLLHEAAKGTPQIDDELPLRLGGRPELLLSATVTPIVDDVGALVGIVVIARDVTAERQAEQRLRSLQKAESLATLATGVAHDFNNLLVQAQGWAELAREDPHDPDLVATALDNISRATHGASELARAMLAYGGRTRFDPERLRLADLVADLRPLLASAVPPKIRLEIDPAADPEVRADPTQLRQIVLNLVTNAAESIGDQPGTIRIRTSSQTVEDPDPDTDRPTHLRLAHGTYAVIEVVDTGPGIDPDHHDRLFDPFFTTKFTGRGLGLAASQGIARAHGGLITVDSRPGDGARFRVHLPVT